MFTQVFMALIAISLSLIAFCAGSWLTIWATSANSQCTEVTAAKLSGYFISVLSVAVLICASYYTARTYFVESMPQGKAVVWKGNKHTGN